MEIISIKCDDVLDLDSNPPYEIVMAILGVMWSALTLIFYLLLVPFIALIPVNFVIFSFFNTAMAKLQKSLDKLEWKAEDIPVFISYVLGVYFWYDISHLMTYFGGFPRC